MKSQFVYRVLALTALFAVAAVPPVTAQDGRCDYTLDIGGEETGTAQVTIGYLGDKSLLSIEVTGAFPDTLYTVWIDHKSRATDMLAEDYPVNHGALDRGVAPAFATTDGTTAGITLDPNAFITDANGDARFQIRLDYNILAPGSSPVVSAVLSMQGLNRLDGSWLRMYAEDPALTASVQVVDPETGRPVLPRSTPQGLTIVRHPDFVSHGHTPGEKDVDHLSAFKGDFPAECMIAAP